MKICLLSNDATYGNGAVLAEGLKHFADVETIFHHKDAKEMYRQTDCKFRAEVPKADHYIVISAISLGRLPKKYYSRGVTVIMTDSKYLKSPAHYNAIFKANGWTVWAMPDLAPLSGTENIYYQPFLMPEVDRRKTELICHSPFCDSKEIQKGTNFIVSICVKNNLPVTVIRGKTWSETIRIKSRHLICVDQLFRGIGKSGLESMLLDSIVLSGVKPSGNHLPPILWTDKKRFENDLLELIFDKKKQGEIIQRQREWALENLDPKVMAKKIIDKI
jgi:hypothetical protein